MNKTRLEAFSDGVLAIIITIMVLELKVPHGSQWNSLLPLLPVFISYVLSFLYIGVYWGNHHHLLHTAHHVNASIILANLHLLFWLSLIPFTTAWMGENYFAPNTIALYSANLFMAGVAYFILQRFIEKTLAPDSKQFAALKKHEWKGIISQVSYAAAVPLAYVSPYLSAIIFFLMTVLWIVPDKRIEKSLD